MLLVLNAYHDALELTLPEVSGAWQLLIDTNSAEGARYEAGSVYTVTGRSLQLFATVS